MFLSTNCCQRLHLQENEGNVFLIEPYHYFKCTAEINNASGNGVLGVEEEDGDANLDNHLEHTLNVLKSVHESFFEGHADGMTGTSAEDQMSGRGKDVKAILNQVRPELCIKYWPTWINLIRYANCSEQALHLARLQYRV